MFGYKLIKKKDLEALDKSYEYAHRYLKIIQDIEAIRALVELSQIEHDADKRCVEWTNNREVIERYNKAGSRLKYLYNHIIRLLDIEYKHVEEGKADLDE